MRPEYRALVHTIDHECRAPPVELPPRHTFITRLERIGRGLCHALHQGYELVGFFGLVVFETVATVLQPRRLRVAALVHQMEETGLNALPIVGLLSFLIGVVFAYQGSDQLRQFGAEVFTVNLLGVGFLRELGGLMAAIIVAGRSGSAFTAQIGTMKVSEEIDAIQVIGPQYRRGAGAAAAAWHHADPAAADILFEHDGSDRRCRHVLSRPRHHHPCLPASAT